MAKIPRKLDFSTMLASSIHDMKNSLGMLLGTLEKIMQQCGPNVCASYSNFFQLQYEGKRVNDHLIQLLALYRIDNSQYLVNISEIYVNDFLEESLLAHQDMLTYRKIHIDVSCPDDLRWFFDRELISGAMTNVINNLYKYTRDKVQITAEEKDSYLVIRIEDNGPGYPDKMLSSDNKTQQDLSFSSGNTGLGLYFATLAAKMHKNKGKVGYISTSNDGIDGGGCFSVFLP